jgi:hypothetical protein
VIRLVPSIQSRTFADVLATPAVDWYAPRMAWSVWGGPTTAEVIGRGSLLALAAQFDRLRCPVVLRTDRGQACWWGYIAQVELRYAKTRIVADLDKMGNWVTILYSEEGGGDAIVTAPATDDRSIAIYGIKEIRENLSQGDLVAAEARRDMLRALYSRPIGHMEFGDAVPAPELRYICRGWFTTFWWRYLLTTDDTPITNLQAMALIATQVGQFFTAIRTETTSTVPVVPVWDGTTKAGDVLLKLASQGTGAVARIFPFVTSDRVLRFVAEPSPPGDDARLLITPDGHILSPTGQPLPPWVAPIGRWAKAKDTPATLTWGYMTDPTRPFLEEAEFDAATGIWQITTRGLLDVFEDLATIPM